MMNGKFYNPLQKIFTQSLLTMVIRWLRCLVSDKSKAMMLQLMLAANVRKCGVRPVLSLPESDKGVPSSVQVQLVVPRFWLAKNDFTLGSIGPKAEDPFVKSVETSTS